MSDRNRIDFTEQEILNLSLDNQDTGLTSLRGMLEYANGAGWVRSPIAGSFPYTQFDWTSGDLDYMGINGSISAADGDTTWVIFKYTWVSGNPTVIKQRVTSWTARASGW
jgi:hypothetical protein